MAEAFSERWSRWGNGRGGGALEGQRPGDKPAWGKRGTSVAPDPCGKIAQAPSGRNKPRRTERPMGRPFSLIGRSRNQELDACGRLESGAAKAPHSTGRRDAYPPLAPQPTSLRIPGDPRVLLSRQRAISKSRSRFNLKRKVRESMSQIVGSRSPG